jgi:hypothetical protein
MRAGLPRRTRFAALGLRRLSGSSNRLYALRRGGRDYILKLFTTEGLAGLSPVERSGREWQALTLLKAWNVDCAPRPILFDPHTSPPAIIMTRVAGKAIRPSRRLTRAMLGGVADALRALHSVTPHEATGETLPTLTDMVAEQRWFAGRIAELGGSAAPTLVDEARQLGEGWLAGGDWPLLLAPAPLAFSRGDVNFTNCLWDGRHVAIVDFEYCGWREPTWDLADLIEADQAWSIAKGAVPLSGSDWDWFLIRYNLAAADHERFLAVQRWLAWVWTLRAWDAFVATELPPARARFTTHLDRMRELCR